MKSVNDTLPFDFHENCNIPQEKNGEFEFVHTILMSSRAKEKRSL